MAQQQQQLPGWTMEQVVGTVIGAALAMAGLAWFAVTSMMTSTDYGEMQARLLLGMAVTVIGLIPLGCSLYSRHRTMTWWRNQQR